jgi:hypothetical protein
MVPIPKKRSLADMQNTDVLLPEEYNDKDYEREVLKLEDRNEEAVDEELVQQAAELGVDVSSVPPTTQNGHISVCESTATSSSLRPRTDSTGSQESTSTVLTFRSSDGQLLNGTSPVLRPRISKKRSLSFSEYDRYLALIEAQQQVAINGPTHTKPSQPAPSIFSVTTRTSYTTIKSSFTRRFKLRRSRTVPARDLRQEYYI